MAKRAYTARAAARRSSHRRPWWRPSLAAPPRAVLTARAACCATRPGPRDPTPAPSRQSAQGLAAGLHIVNDQARSAWSYQPHDIAARPPWRRTTYTRAAIRVSPASYARERAPPSYSCNQSGTRPPLTLSRHRRLAPRGRPAAVRTPARHQATAHVTSTGTLLRSRIQSDCFRGTCPPPTPLGHIKSTPVGPIDRSHDGRQAPPRLGRRRTRRRAAQGRRGAHVALLPVSQHSTTQGELGYADGSSPRHDVDNPACITVGARAGTPLPARCPGTPGRRARALFGEPHRTPRRSTPPIGEHSARRQSPAPDDASEGAAPPPLRGAARIADHAADVTRPAMLSAPEKPALLPASRRALPDPAVGFLRPSGTFAVGGSPTMHQHRRAQGPAPNGHGPCTPVPRTGSRHVSPSTPPPTPDTGALSYPDPDADCAARAQPLRLTHVPRTGRR